MLICLQADNLIRKSSELWIQGNAVIAEPEMEFNMKKTSTADHVTEGGV